MKAVIANTIDKGNGAYNKIAKMMPSEMPIHNNRPKRYCSLVFMIVKPLELLCFLLLYILHVID